MSSANQASARVFCLCNGAEEKGRLVDILNSTKTLMTSSLG